MLTPPNGPRTARASSISSRPRTPSATRNSRPPTISSSLGARALIIYGYEPSGHSAAAFALESAGHKAGLSFSRVEIAAGHHPVAGLAVACGYHALLAAAPEAWRALYYSAWARCVLRAVRSAYLDLGGARRLRAGVRRSGAQVVVCPQAAVAAVLAEARRRRELDIPVVSVLTDYGVHPFWADPPADLILTPSQEAVETLVGRGVPRARLRATGIPVHPAFAVPPSRDEARRALALPAAALVVLLTGGGKGLGGLGAAASALLRENLRVRLLVLCGVNDQLHASLCGRREAGSRLRVFGPQPPEMVALMMAASDLHLGKPGGLSAAESLASGLPMLLSHPLPGQEEANARHLLAVGAAVGGDSPEQAALLASRLLNALGASMGACLHGCPRTLARMRAAALGAGLPHSAASAVAAIADLTAPRRPVTMVSCP